MPIINVVDQFAQNCIRRPSCARRLLQNIFDFIQQDEDSSVAAVTQETRETTQHLLCILSLDRFADACLPQSYPKFPTARMNVLCTKPREQQLTPFLISIDSCYRILPQCIRKAALETPTATDSSHRLFDCVSHLERRHIARGASGSDFSQFGKPVVEYPVPTWNTSRIDGTPLFGYEVSCEAIPNNSRIHLFKPMKFNSFSPTGNLYVTGHPISRESQLDEPREKVRLTLTVATFEPTHARTTADFQFFQVVACSSEQKIAACRKESSALKTIATLSKGLKDPQRVFSVDFNRRVQTRSSR